MSVSREVIIAFLKYLLRYFKNKLHKYIFAFHHYYQNV